jgi:2-polyprenyl-3-methyl-5-hydroxy-6-metoxy-1,4-benzoquinol methylase
VKKFKIDNKIYKNLSTQDERFLKKAYRTDFNFFKSRLKSIKFVNKKKVLDAGCGFGQWSFALAQNNYRVIGIDYNKIRIKIANKIKKKNYLKNLSFVQGSLEHLPFKNETFDAIFSYSVIYHTNYKRSILEMKRVLKNNGKLYINFNGLGWFFYMIVVRGLLKLDLVNIKKGFVAIFNTIVKKNSIRALKKKKIMKFLNKNNLKVLKTGGDGEITFNRSLNKSFYKKKYFGLDGVVEIISQKVV